MHVGHFCAVCGYLGYRKELANKRRQTTIIMPHQGTPLTDTLPPYTISIDLSS